MESARRQGRARIDAPVKGISPSPIRLRISMATHIDPKRNPGDDAEAGTPGTGEDICDECSGSGKLSDGRPCPNCGGTGKVIHGIGGG